MNTFICIFVGLCSYKNDEEGGEGDAEDQVSGVPRHNAVSVKAHEHGGARSVRYLHPRK